MTSKTTSKRDSTGRFLADHNLEVNILDISIALIGLRSAKGMGVAGLVEAGGGGVEVRVVIKVLRSSALLHARQDAFALPVVAHPSTSPNQDRRSPIIQ